MIKQLQEKIVEEENEIIRLKHRLRDILKSRGYKIATEIDKIAATLGLVKKRKINKKSRINNTYKYDKEKKNFEEGKGFYPHTKL